MKSILFILIITGYAAAASGQSKAVDKLAKEMTDSLNYLQLTDKQKQDALALNTTAATSMVQLKQKAKQDTSLKGATLFQQVLGIMKTRNKGLSALLVPDQHKLFQQHEAEQIADLKTKMMTAQLDLTPQQIPQVYQVNLKETAESMKEMAKLQAAKSKLAKLGPARALKSASKDQDNALKKILSASQYDAFEKNKEAMQAAMKEKKA